MKLAQAILLLPPGVYLKCGCEQRRQDDGEDNGAFGSACLLAEPPEDGWPDPRHPADKFLDRVIASISTDETDFESFESLTVHMIVDRYGNVRQRQESKEFIERRARQRQRREEREDVDSSTVKASW